MSMMKIIMTIRTLAVFGNNYDNDEIYKHSVRKCLLFRNKKEVEKCYKSV